MNWDIVEKIISLVTAIISLATAIVAYKANKRD